MSCASKFSAVIFIFCFSFFGLGVGAVVFGVFGVFGVDGDMLSSCSSMFSMMLMIMIICGIVCYTYFNFLFINRVRDYTDRKEK